MRKKKKISPLSYQERTYRRTINPAGLVSCFVKVCETDLHIMSSKDVTDQAYRLVYQHRNQLENYLAAHPVFLTAMTPLPPDPLAPPIVKKMLTAAAATGVGPMAAVAGAIAEFIGLALLADGINEVIVENGGDIFINRAKECIISIFAGESPLSRKVGVRIAAARMPLGVCTSSGTVGHSLSLGKADSVTVLAASTSLADAAATRLGNEISTPGSSKNINLALEKAKTIHDLLGVVIICGQQLGAWGEVDLVNPAG